MEEGKWRVCAPLVFEEETGALLDGQNRLQALVETAKEFLQITYEIFNFLLILFLAQTKIYKIILTKAQKIATSNCSNKRFDRARR